MQYNELIIKFELQIQHIKMKIITVAKADKEEEKNEVSSASAVSRNCKKSIKKDKRKRCKYVYIK